MECKICGKEIKNNGALMVHQTTCEYVSKIKENIIKLYVIEFWSIKRIKDKYNLGSQTIVDILGDSLRTMGESNKIARKMFPESFNQRNVFNMECNVRLLTLPP